MKNVKTGVFMLGLMALLATPTLALWERGMGIREFYTTDEAFLTVKGIGRAQLVVTEGIIKIEKGHKVSVDRNKDTEVKYFGNGRIVRGVQWTEYYDFDSIIVNGKETIVVVEHEYQEEPAAITAKGTGNAVILGTGWYFAKDLN